ncbi:MAG: flagellar filament capping protein FliD [Treponema sp.]|jgi:flagellar hook-associated protein 2|nr:flagellar filament capping protein FliD [Treponema sp.]
MSDVYVPGVKSRFNSEKLIEDLMKLERVPKERNEQNIENLQTQKGYWQEVGRRISAVQESARLLYSFQNPFNERSAVSSNESALVASATKEAVEQIYNFTVKQIAQADRFISSPLDEKMKVGSGIYTFLISNNEISINFRGGTLREFVDTINRRGQNKISASLITVKSGTKSLLIESKVTGEENRLGFSNDAASMMLNIGMMEQGNDTRKDITISENTVRKTGTGSIAINDGVLKAGVRSSALLPIGISLAADSPVIMKLETSTKADSGAIIEISQPPPGPSIPSGSVTYGDITVSNEPSSAPFPEWKAPEIPQRNDDMAVLSLVFTDGSAEKLPPISDSGAFVSRQYRLSDFAQGRTIASLKVDNNNTHREISISKIEIFDPTSVTGGLRPLNPVSTAQNAVITMEGIEITRPDNSISDIIPGLTLNIKGISERPVELKVGADIAGIKDSIISFVGNYNRLISEINVLTRTDNRIIDELSYVTADEAADMKKRLGAFSGDTTLNSFKSGLQRAVSAPYPTSMERDLALLSQIGISTNARNQGGSYEPSRLRGYLEINEKTLDAALDTNLMAIKELFASDTSGDLIMDTGVAVNVDALVKPFLDRTSGIVALKTNSIDSRITQDQRRIDTMDRQLAAKEQELKIQYSKMEAAYSRMEQMTNSLENFSQQNRNNNNR